MPSVDLNKHVQHHHQHSEEWASVARIADTLHLHLNTEDALRRIAIADQPGESSNGIQETFGDFVRELGFEREKQGLFASLELGLRPDYFKKIGETGILLEVERGKTTINNMDVLDFWKCHLCPHAHYLFLLVPKALRQNASSAAARKEFETVDRRLSKFFQDGNYTNVRGLCLFGY